MEEQIIKAIEQTRINAINLFEDGKLLLLNNRKERAYTLFHFTVEECGRFYLLFNFLTEFYANRIKKKDFNFGNLKNNGYSKHQIKISKCFQAIHWMILTESILKRNIYYPTKDFLINDPEIKNIANSLKKYINLEVELDKLKNSSLYITFENNKFYSPVESINDVNLKSIKMLAKSGIEAIKGINDILDKKGGFTNYKVELQNFNIKCQ